MRETTTFSIKFSDNKDKIKNKKILSDIYSQLPEDLKNPVLDTIINGPQDKIGGQDISLLLKRYSKKSNELFVIILSTLKKISEGHQLKFDLYVTGEVIDTSTSNVVDWFDIIYKFSNGFKFDYSSPQFHHSDLCFFYNDFKFLTELSSNYYEKNFLDGTPFYNPNYPDKIKGYEIKEISDDVYTYLNKKL